MAWVSYIYMVTICRIHVEEIFAYIKLSTKTIIL